MKISCPSCAAKYSITDEKVRDRLAKIRCRKCGTTIVIDGKVDPPAVTAAAAAATSSEASADPGYGADAGYGGGAETGPLPGDYSVDMGDDDQRSMSVQQIVDAYHAGEISDMTYVWADGMIDWQRVADVAELANAIGLNTGYAPPESQPLSSRAATRSGVGRGSAADLFGGIESAGSEDDVTTSAPEPIAAPAPTGARNESSVLFSLSALTGTATPTAPIAVSNPSFPPKVSTTTAASSEDSGLIDLKALTASVPGTASDVMMAPVSPLLGAPPLGVSAPLGGVGAVPATADVNMSSGRSGSKSGLFIGGAIVVVGLAAVLAFVARGGSEEPKPEPAAVVAPAAATTAARPAETARPTPPPTKTAEATAEPPPTGTVAAAEPPASAKPSATPPASTAARAITGSAAPAKRKPTPATSSASSPSSSTSSSSSSSSSSSASTSTPAAAPAEPKSTKKKCDCKPSDLMCAMKCSAK